MPPLNVLFADNHLLVVDKAAGIATMGSQVGEPTVARQAAEYLQRKYNKPGKAFIGVVSRLDRLVSGVLVLARTSKAASRLSEQLRQQSICKFYIAMVEGRPEGAAPSPQASSPLAPSAGSALTPGRELVDWVVKDEAAHRMRVLSDSRPHLRPGAQEARLRFQILAISREQALLHIQLLTGRKHQIRLQLSALGNPICGDAKYGARSQFTPGIALHCRQVTIVHPTLKESLTFTSSPANHWKNIPAAFLPTLDRLDA